MKKTILLFFILSFFSSCFLKKKSYYSKINSVKITTSLIKINNWHEFFTLDSFSVSVNPSVKSKSLFTDPTNKSDNLGIIHHYMGVSYTINFELSIKQNSSLNPNERIVIDEIQLVTIKHEIQNAFDDSCWTDTVKIIPRFKIVKNKGTKNPVQVFKGNVGFWHFGSSRKNKLIIQFKDKYHSFVTQWHKS
ncbi:MAG: hypothetical protein V4613_12455 [Bacteroidota bacterium]